MSTAPAWAPPLRSRWALFLLGLRHLGDGLCHAYIEYQDMDCRQPSRHDGDHGNRPERETR